MNSIAADRVQSTDCNSGSRPAQPLDARASFLTQAASQAGNELG